MSEIIVNEETIKRHRYAVACWHCYRIVGFDDNDISCRGVHTEGKYMTTMNEHVVCPYCRARIWTGVDEAYERFKNMPKPISEKLSELSWEMQKPKNKRLYKYNKRRIRHTAAWCIVLTGGTDNA